MKTRFFILTGLIFAGVAQLGCSLFDTGVFGATDTATVIAKTAQIRTSYSVVAADLLEVKRGDRLDVVDQVEFEKVNWYRVRAHDETATEGWIEAQNVITSNTLEKSKKLAENYANRSPQAAGIIRSASNLRSAPDVSPENVLFKLANGSTFEISNITGWDKPAEPLHVEGTLKVPGYATEAGRRARMSFVRSPWGSITVAAIGDWTRARTRLSRSVLLPEPVEPKTAR